MSESEQKKPQAGEWWFVNGRNDRVYIVGIREDGKTIFQTHKGGDMLPDFDGDWSSWHHEPRCTGWDWQPEPEPEWFDLTPFGEHVLRYGVDWCRKGDDYDWMAVHGLADQTIEYAKRNSYQQFRCLLKDAPPELVAKEKKPQQPKTEREVLLFWYDGNVVGCYADCPPTDPSFVPLIIRDGKVLIELETREVVR